MIVQCDRVCHALGLWAKQHSARVCVWKIRPTHVVFEPKVCCVVLFGSLSVGVFLFVLRRTQHQPIHLMGIILCLWVRVCVSIFTSLCLMSQCGCVLAVVCATFTTAYLCVSKRASKSASVSLCVYVPSGVSVSACICGSHKRCSAVRFIYEVEECVGLGFVCLLFIMVCSVVQ